MKQITLTQIEGIEFGSATLEEAGTGCSVIICRKGATAGVDVRGGGPATRETDLLRPENMIDAIHAVCISGGSAFGLDAAGGVMHYLEEAGVGFDTGVVRVPIVCGASLFDLGVGSATIRPDRDLGYQACLNAQAGAPIEEGNVGAGCGASVGKFLGPDRCMKGGLGSAGVMVGDLKIAAISAVNALGTVCDDDGTPIAGATSEDGARILSWGEACESMLVSGPSAWTESSPVNTTISCIVTNAILTKAQATRVAMVAHDGYARAIRPVHTNNDGDTIFVLATGEVVCDRDLIGILASDVVASAIRSGVRHAKSAYGIRAACDL